MEFYLGNRRKIIFLTLIFSSLIIVCCLLFLWQGIYLPKKMTPSESIVFTIKKGQGVRQISDNLEKQGLIKSKFFFNFYIWLKGEKADLKAGSYSLSPDMNIPRITEKIILGEIIKKKITILEGWDLKTIAENLEKEKIYSKKDFLEAVYSPEVKEYISRFNSFEDKPENLNFEGYFFPDTYEIILGMTAQEFVKNIFANFDKKISKELKEEIEARGKTIFEIITMASIIEKEVKTFKDKKMVSGILWKRLEIGMPLQVDATINYITGKNHASVLIADTKIDSPYNTYKYKGLPLGPICNPGLESIRAAVEPEENSYLYYLSTPQGITIFSKTLKEHNIAKTKYLK